MRDTINSCDYLLLREIGEPRDNALRLVVEEAKANGPPEDIEILPGRAFRGSRAIESDATCRAFELVWPSYVSYSVRNESFCTADEQEASTGRLFCLYSKSHYLDFVARATIADSDYPGPLRHWGIKCLNHIVDVVSATEPVVREL
jgi:hypothetical protein